MLEPSASSLEHCLSTLHSGCPSAPRPRAPSCLFLLHPSSSPSCWQGRRAKEHSTQQQLLCTDAPPVPQCHTLALAHTRGRVVELLRCPLCVRADLHGLPHDLPVMWLRGSGQSCVRLLPVNSSSRVHRTRLSSSCEANHHISARQLQSRPACDSAGTRVAVGRPQSHIVRLCRATVTEACISDVATGGCEWSLLLPAQQYTECECCRDNSTSSAQADLHYFDQWPLPDAPYVDHFAAGAASAPASSGVQGQPQDTAEPILLDSTWDYFASAAAPPRVKAVAPHARFVVILQVRWLPAEAHTASLASCWDVSCWVAQA
jgi:hypothetical protein